METNLIKEAFKGFMEGFIKGALGMTGVLLTIWFVKDCYNEM